MHSMVIASIHHRICLNLKHFVILLLTAGREPTRLEKCARSHLALRRQVSNSPADKQAFSGTYVPLSKNRRHQSMLPASLHKSGEMSLKGLNPLQPLSPVRKSFSLESFIPPRNSRFCHRE